MKTRDNIIAKSEEKKALLKSAEHHTHTEEPTRLRVGDVIQQGGKEMVVWFLNDCRAVIAPLSSRIHCRIREADGKIQFLAKEDTESISPNSDCEITRRLGRKGLMEELRSYKTMSKETKTSKGETTTTRQSAGKLGGVKGHSVTSTIRAFGKAGWSFEEAQAYFVKKQIPVADATIKIQLNAGKKGKGGDPADFTKDELAAMKPKVKVAKEDKKSAKTEKKAKKAKKAAVEDEEEDDLENTEPPTKEEEAEAEEEEQEV